MFGLSKKKSAGGPAPAGPRIPTEKVVSLSSQGLSEPEIIKTLREDGFSPLEVDRAMKDALRTGTGVQPPQAPPSPGRPGPTGPTGPPPLPGAPPSEPLPPPPPQMAPPPSPPVPGQPPIPGQQPASGLPPAFSQPQQYQPSPWDVDDDLDDEMKDLPKEKRMGPSAFMDDLDAPLPPGPPGVAGEEKEPLAFNEPLPKGGDDRVRELKDRRRKDIEEITEEVTEEKWSDMTNRVHAIESKIDEMAAGVKSATDQVQGPGMPPQEIESMRKDIEDFKHTIEDANARIDSLEEVVKGSLTPMVESIRKFSHAVKTSKKGEPVTIEEPTEGPKPPAAAPSSAPVAPEPKPPTIHAPPDE